MLAIAWATPAPRPTSLKSPIYFRPLELTPLLCTHSVRVLEPAPTPPKPLQTPPAGLIPAMSAPSVTHTKPGRANIIRYNPIEGNYASR